jgi:hypothetical protein
MELTMIILNWLVVGPILVLAALLGAFLLVLGTWPVKN